MKFCTYEKEVILMNDLSYNAETGIRTQGSVTFAGFQDRCLKPTRPSLQICPRPESNRYEGLARRILSPVRLPVPPLGHVTCSTATAHLVYYIFLLTSIPFLFFYKYFFLSTFYLLSYF